MATPRRTRRSAHPVGSICRAAIIISFCCVTFTTLAHHFHSSSPKDVQLMVSDAVPAKVADNSSHPLTRALKHKIWQRPQTSNVPERAEFALRRELVEYRAVNNKIVVTLSNFAYVEFVLNWVRYLNKCGVYNILVGAMDKKLLDALFLEGVPVFDLESDLSTKPASWDSSLFHKMGRHKVVCVNAILSLGFELLLSDADIVWLRNPLPYFARWQQADVFTSTDELSGYAVGEGLEPWDTLAGEFNNGITYWRPSFPAQFLGAAWSAVLAGNDSLWDQLVFNNLLLSDIGTMVDEKEPAGLVYAFDGHLKLGILSVSLFCSGHTFFVQKLPSKLGLHPFSVHTTFQFSEMAGKQHRLREAMLFEDSAAYYNPPGGFVVAKYHIPSQLMHPPSFNLSTHFSLINYQLKKIRSLLAMATLLNRTAIMPRLWCHFDRLWYTHNGTLPATHTSQPFLCPMDHIFEIKDWLEDFDKARFGPPIAFREYSILSNPRMPSNVKQSVLTVNITNECSHTSDASICVPSHSSHSQVINLLESHRQTKIYSFVSMDDLHGKWDSSVNETKFRWRISHYLSKWCCGTFEGGLDHIWYDFFVDEKPEWQPLPPESDEDDYPSYTAEP